MASSGFSEEQSEYSAPNQPVAIGQFRRLGGVGPAYQVLDIAAENVTIEVVESEEIVRLKLADVGQDPLTDTIP